MAKNNRTDIEKTLSQLESIINKLEDQRTTLHESLNAFEQGIKLSRNAQQTLSEAEQKINLLLESDGKPENAIFSEKTPE